MRTISAYLNAALKLQARIQEVEMDAEAEPASKTSSKPPRSR